MSFENDFLRSLSTPSFTSTDSTKPIAGTIRLDKVYPQAFPKTTAPAPAPVTPAAVTSPVFKPVSASPTKIVSSRSGAVEQKANTTTEAQNALDQLNAFEAQISKVNPQGLTAQQMANMQYDASGNPIFSSSTTNTSPVTTSPKPVVPTPGSTSPSTAIASATSSNTDSNFDALKQTSANAMDAYQAALGRMNAPVTIDEQNRINSAVEGTGASFDALIRQAAEKKRQGMGRAVVGAGQAGGFLNSQVAGQAAVAPTTAENGFVGVGGELENTKSAYDATISALEAQKIAAVENARAAAQEAIRTGKEADLGRVQKFFEEAQNAYQQSVTLADQHASTLAGLQKAQKDLNAPITVSPDTSIVNPTTGEVIYTSPARTPEDQANYNFYSTQERTAGRTPKSFDEFINKSDPTADQKNYDYYSKQETAAGRKPMSFDAYRTLDANRKARIAYTNAQGLDTATSTRVDRLTGQFDGEPIVKKFNVIQEANQFVQSLKDNPNSTNDQALIYSFAKALDPDSVVREGEYATVQKYAQSWAEQLGFDVKRIFTNSAFLTPEARQQIANTIGQKFNITEHQYKNLVNEYGRRVDQITGNNDGTSYVSNYGGAFDAPSSSGGAGSGTSSSSSSGGSNAGGFATSWF